MKSREKLIQVKTALAEKYERLACLTSSHPRRKSLRLRADQYRRQVQALSKD